MGLQWLKMKPDEEHYQLFTDLPKVIYPENSQRIGLGHEPVEENLHSCYVAQLKEQTVARFALYLNPALEYGNKRTCTIGSYECIENSNIAKEVLSFAQNEALQQGAEFLIGPMEGSTWNSHRFSRTHEGPNFFLEPYHHLYYNDHFINFGFKEIAQYSSNIVDNTHYNAQRIEDFDKRLADRGVKIRQFNMGCVEEELFKIAVFSNEAFHKNFLFTPIDPKLFVAKYKKLSSYFKPELIWMLEDAAGELHALMFALHDYCDTSNKTIIVKTVARKASSPHLGVGTYLVDKLMQQAKAMGYERAIHAFMLDSNDSRIISDRFDTDSVKHYTLYGKEL